MNRILNVLKGTVSRDKQRFKDGEFDLDLTYITERVIAMSFPASPNTVESTYRNNVVDVGALLKKRHVDHFRIYNLSQRAVDSRFLDHRVVDWCGFPDHHNPPLWLLLRIVRDMIDFLSAESNNVVVVHCLAGKGRTGTAIIALLLFSGLFDSASDAAMFFAAKRSANHWGVTGPSQRRYIDYVHLLLRSGIVPSRNTFVLKKIELLGVPSSLNLSFSVRVDTDNGTRVLFKSCGDVVIDGERRSNTTRVIGLDVSDQVAQVLVTGDINITMKHSGLVRSETFLRCGFHVGLEAANGSVLSFRKSMLDGNVRTDKRFGGNFELRVYLGERVVAEELDDDVFAWRPEPTNPPGSILFFPTPDLADKVAKAAGDAEHGLLEMAGWLEKRGNVVKSWKRRWFVLDANALHYFTSPSANAPKGSIDLSSVWAVRSADDEDGKTCLIEVVTPERNFLLAASDPGERDEWIETLQGVMSMDPAREQRPKLGTLHVHVKAFRAPGCPVDEVYAVEQYDRQRFRSMDPVQFDIFDDPLRWPSLSLSLWQESGFSTDRLLGEVVVDLGTEPGKSETWYSFPGGSLLATLEWSTRRARSESETALIRSVEGEDWFVMVTPEIDVRRSRGGTAPPTISNERLPTATEDV